MLKQGKIGLNLENCLIGAVAYQNVDKIKGVFKNASFEVGAPAGEGNFTPKPEDYIYVPFRFITATIVGGGSWKATDFTREGVLKKAASMLKNKPVFLDHATYSVKNGVGVVVDCFWSEGYTTADGVVVPPGIDGVIRIDGKNNEKLARDLKSDPPVIQSCSVTVVYQYEASHTFLKSDGSENPYEFEWKVGTIIKNEATGIEEMVRRICVEVEDFLELSLVTWGADPFAKYKDENGNLINIDKTAIVSNSKFEAEPEANAVPNSDIYWFNLYRTNNIYFSNISFGNDRTIYLAQIFPEKTGENQPDMDFKIALSKMLNVEPKDVTEELLGKYSFIKTEDLGTLNTNLTNANTELTKVKGELELAKKQVTEKETLILNATTREEKLKGEVAELEGYRTHKEEALTELRASVLAAHTKANNGKESESFKKILEKADEPDLKELAKEYNVALVEKFGGAFCTKCNSNESITFQKSEADEKNNFKKGRKHIGEAFA